MKAGGMKDENVENEDLRSRTKNFALRIIKLYSNLPKTTEAQVLGKQIIRSGTSVGAQYREGCRAKSNADFVSKLEGSLQELEETCYWLELIVESEIFDKERISPLQTEAEEIIKILVTIIRKVKGRQ